MKMIDYVTWAAAIVLPVAATIGQATTLDMSTSAPGIVAPSFPLFLDTGETVKVQKKGIGTNTYYQLTGSGSNTLFMGSLFNFKNLGSDSVKYQANFNLAGDLITSSGGTALTNYVEVKGSLPSGTFGGTSWPAQPNKLLLSAKLTDVGTYRDFAVGFATEFTGGWVTTYPGFTGGSTGESLWLTSLSSGFSDLVKALDDVAGNGTLSSRIGNSKTFNNVISVTSVPLPGAFWLFGAGLTALLTRGRHNNKSYWSLTA